MVQSIYQEILNFRTYKYQQCTYVATQFLCWRNIGMVPYVHHKCLFIDEIVMSLITTLNTSWLLCKKNIVDYFLRNFCFRFVYCLCVIRWFSHSENLDTVLVVFANNHDVECIPWFLIKIDTVVGYIFETDFKQNSSFFSRQIAVCFGKSEWPFACAFDQHIQFCLFFCFKNIKVA